MNFFAIVFACCIASLPALAGDVALPWIDMITGAPQITIHRGGTDVLLKKTDKLLPNDTFVVPAKVGLRIVFPDGSEAWVGPGSLGKVRSASTPDGHGIQLLTLPSGIARVIVPHPDTGNRRIKFVVKTAAATLGVRGTDFVIEGTPQGKATELHTLEGTVDTAESIAALNAENRTPITSGQMVRAVPGAPIPPPTAFDVTEYKRSLLARIPAFVTFTQNPAKHFPDLKDLQTPAKPGQPLLPGNTWRDIIRNQQIERENQLDRQIGE